MREDWVLCNKGECKCLTISDRASDSPVCKVFDGKWGDDYPALRIVGDSLQQKVEPYMEQITYGEIPHEEAVRRARLIAAAPDLLEAGRRALVFLQDNGLSHGADLARAIAKAEGR